MASSLSIVSAANHPYRFRITRQLNSGGALRLPPLPNRSSSSSSSPGYFWSQRSFPRARKIERILRRVIAGIGRFSAPLISPNDQWGIWTALTASAAFGIWSEKTRVGSAISGGISILVGLAASSAGVIAADSPVYPVVMEFLLPLAVPLLLFNADLRRVIRSTGTLLLAFLIGSDGVPFLVIFLVQIESLSG